MQITKRNVELTTDNGLMRVYVLARKAAGKYQSIVLTTINPTL
ncbi:MULTISPECIES: hypothetical protein [unclassified Nostoc]|nr:MULTISPECIES: hypothetical protein [unclassified Nostoc]